MRHARPITGHPRLSKYQTGFSLIEVVAAAAILGIAISALTIMIGNSDVLGRESDHYRQARIIAMHELEDPWSHFFNYSSGHNKLEDIYLDADSHSPLLAKNHAWKGEEQNPILAGEIIPYKTIQAEVTWTESPGKPRSVKLYKRIVDLQ